MNTADFQRTCSDYVNKHVLTCISTLVSDNFSQWIEGDYEDELYAVTAQDDYETPVLDWLNNRAEDDQADELREWIEVNIGLAYCDDIETDKQLLSQGLDIITGSMDGPHDPDWRDLAEHLDIDPEQREALEHWIVSDHLAYHLEQAGEMITRDLYGMTVWGRTTSGQAISIDSVIETIVREVQDA